MEEKQIISKTDDIVEAIVNISLGKSSFLSKLPGSLVNFLTKEENAVVFMKLKQCYIEYLAEVDSRIENSSDVKRLSDFRFKLYSLYEEAKGIENKETEEEDNTPTDTE